MINKLLHKELNIGDEVVLISDHYIELMKLSKFTVTDISNYYKNIRICDTNGIGYVIPVDHIKVINPISKKIEVLKKSVKSLEKSNFLNKKLLYLKLLFTNITITDIINKKELKIKKDMIKTILTDQCQPGDKVKVIGNTCSHNYIIGNEYTVAYMTGNGPVLEGSTYYANFRDVALITPKPITDKVKELKNILEFLENEVVDDTTDIIGLEKKYKAYQVLKTLKTKKNDSDLLNYIMELV